MNPYVSFVCALNRVDTYPDLMRRFRHCMQHIANEAQKCGLEHEVIVVDWNSPTAFPLIPQQINLIRISESQHKQFINPHGQLFFEWRAKNVGIRAAKGDFILCHNADDIFSASLMERIAERNLTQTNFYRANRYDIQSENAPWFQVQRPSGQFAREEDFTISQTGVPYSPDMLAFRASGDFMLMSRENWLLLRGFPEVPYDGSVDGQMVWIAHKAGLMQVLLKEPLYHLDHARTGRRMYTPPWEDSKPFGEMNRDDNWGRV